MERIKHSVGQGGWNFPQDVAIVQALLNRHRPSTRPLLAVDKVAAGLTIQAIKEFQKQVVNLPQPDGRIDPTGLTAEYLYTSPTWLTVQGTAKYLTTLTSTIETGLKRTALAAASMLPINMFSQHNKIAWGAKVSPEFKAKVITICKNLDIQPDHLMTCMAFETGATFSPKVPNAAGSGAVGLIQFVPATAVYLKTTPEKLAAMSAVQQLDYVEKFLKDYKNKMHTLEDVYMAIFHPRGIGKDPGHVLFEQGRDPEYDKNAGLDKNRDKKITIREISTNIRRMYEMGLRQGYLG